MKKSIAIIFILSLPLQAFASAQVLFGKAQGYDGATYSIISNGDLNATPNHGDVLAFPVSGSVSTLEAYRDYPPGGTATETFTVQKNGVDTALKCTIQSGAQTCSDTSDGPISYTAGVDTILMHVTASGVPANDTPTWGVVFTPNHPNDTVFFQGNLGQSLYFMSLTGLTAFLYNNVSNVAAYGGSGGGSYITSSYSYVQNIFGESGTLDQLRVTAEFAPTSPGTWFTTIMYNNATSTLQCTVTSASKTCSDTTDTQPVTAGGVSFISAASSGNSTSTGEGIMMRFTPTTPGNFDFFSNSFGTVDTANATVYQPVTFFKGYGNFYTTEASTTIVVPTTMTVTSMTVLRSVGPGTGHTVTYSIRKNLADSGFSCQLTGSATTNTCTGSATFSAGDVIDVADTLDTGGAVGAFTMGIVANVPPPTPRHLRLFEGYKIKFISGKIRLY